MKVCVFGLGQGGSSLAADLAVAGADVVAYDPAPVATPAGVKRLPHPALAAARSALILGLTSEADAELALLQAIEVFPEDTVYADLSTASPAAKEELASMASAAKVRYADVALISDGADRGLNTTSFACGEGAERYAELVSELGGRVEVMSGDSGAASRRKLLRSIVLSGTAAVVAEAMRAAAAAEDLDWLWANINAEILEADAGWLSRLVNDHKSSSLRQLGEATAARSLLVELGVGSAMSEATIQNLQDLPALGMPDLPAPKDDSVQK